jgi:hypothetical protein
MSARYANRIKAVKALYLNKVKVDQNKNQILAHISDCFKKKIEHKIWQCFQIGIIQGR